MAGVKVPTELLKRFFDNIAAGHDLSLGENGDPGVVRHYNCVRKFHCL